MMNSPGAITFMVKVRVKRSQRDLWVYEISTPLDGPIPLSTRYHSFRFQCNNE